MGKSISKVAYSIIEQYEAYRVKDDIDLDYEYVKDKCFDARNALITADLEKNKKIDLSYYTRCQCVPIQCEQIVCGDNDSGLTKRFIDVSNIIIGFDGKSIIYLGPPTFSEEDRWRLFFSFNGIGGQHTRNNLKPIGRLIGDQIILENVEPETEVASMLAITKNGYCGEICDDEVDFPAPAGVINMIEQAVLKSIIPFAFRVQKDVSNDAAEKR